MFRSSLLLILIVAIVFIAQSCNKGKDDHCPFLAPEIVFVGFTEDESDTMIIRRFEKNTNFTKLIDTVRITKAHLQRIEVGKDSFRLAPDNYPQLNSLLYAHDWQLHLPKAKKTALITDVTPKFTQEKQPTAQCQSYVSSVMFDSQLFTFTSWFDTQYRIYATK